jgi:magnesium and cobalt transporter
MTMKIMDGIRFLFGRSKKHLLRQSIEELLAEVNYPEPSLREGEKKLIANVLELWRLSAEDVMVPRSDIIAMPLHMTSEEVFRMVDKESHSCFPVYGENLDDLLGFVYTKDLLQKENRTKFDLRKLLNRPLFVPVSIPALELLLKMRHEKIPLAVVIDEYGGTDGIVTPWDILEEILGDMKKADMEEIEEIQHLTSGQSIVDARLPIKDFEAEFGQILTPEEEMEDIGTVNGLILYLAGRVPNRTEVIEHSSGMEFEILEANLRSVLKVKVTQKKIP